VDDTCDTLSPTYNGARQVIHGAAGEACSVVEFSCRNGSSLIGNPLVTCRPDGEYNFPTPSCSGEFLLEEYTAKKDLLPQMCVVRFSEQPFMLI
jgi:hypothetical protein